MFEVYLATALVLTASLLIGGAILDLLGWPRPAWLAGATGLAALVVIAPFAIRLPGRALTAAILIGLLCLAAALVLLRGRRPRAGEPAWPVAVAVVALALALASVPFVLNERVGVLGEGIYTNDHAAQLFWAQWLRDGFGPEPSAVSFGYPIGPQAVAAIAAEATGISLVAAFNGLLVAIPALTGLAALGALTDLAPGRRIAVAAVCALPYLLASFLAQSAFKETAMALFVLAFAVALASLARAGPRAVGAVGLILAAAAVFTFSLPGLAWFGLALAVWLVLEAFWGEGVVEYRAVARAVSAHRVAVALGALVALALAVLAIGPATSFIDKIDDVQASAGRLSSPVFPGEAFGLWPQGDFRIVRGEVSGGLLVAALGALAAAYGVWVLARRRQLALLATLIAGAIVYLGARLFAEIHVEAKALAVIAPLVLLVALRALLAPSPSNQQPGSGDQRPATSPLRTVLGTALLVGAAVSTLLALRAAPVGFDDRAAGLERLGERVEGETVAFLGVDRFSGYRLRGTLARAPAGYVPEEIESRPGKRWQQGQAADFDSLDSGKLDKFDYAITTTAAYASAPPANFEPLVQSGDYVLWRRDGQTPRSRVLDEGGAPGAVECLEPTDREALASVFAREPALADEWHGTRPVETAAAGQERAFLAPATATASLDLPAPGRYALSLQYHSQAPLEVLVDGEPVAELAPSLDGMYLDGAGRGAFWPAGELDAAEAGPTEVAVRAIAPSGLQDALGVERRVWLGELAATSAADPVARRLRGGCDAYVDHFRFRRGGQGR